MNRRSDEWDIKTILAWGFVCSWNILVFLLVSGVCGYFAITLFRSGDYFFSAICAALFIKFLVKGK